MDSNKLASILIQAQVEVAKIEGMKAENQYRTAMGDTPCYNEWDFLKIADRLEELANKAEML